MYGKIAIIFCVGMLACGTMVDAHAQTASAPSALSARQQTEAKQLHAAIMAGFQYENGGESKEAYVRRMQETVARKLRTLLPEQRQLLEKELNDSLKQDASGMGVAAFYMTATLLDTWHRHLQAIPALQTPEYEALRQKWLAQVQQAESKFWQAKDVDWQSLLQEFSVFTKQNGLAFE